MNIVSCTTWVRRGVAAAVPEKVELTTKELEEIIKQTQVALQDDDSGKEEEEEFIKDKTNLEKNKIENEHDVNNSSMEVDEYDFDKYDKESGDIHCSIGNIVSFGEDGKDPLIKSEETDDDSEKEDDIIKSDDNLVLIGHVDGDASILEIFVYNEAEGSFYCHHDILLPSFPLCIEWLSFDPSDAMPANLCAIGSMTSIIEVWDLDLIDCLEPAFKLGRKPNKKKKLTRIGHRDAVLDLAWNKNYTHILASGSVDQTVLLWDLENGKPATKFNSFNEKVQTLEWHPSEAHHLLTGCADGFARLFDCKLESNAKEWQTPGEIERVLWNHFDPNYFLISTNNGYLEYYDIREDSPIWQIKAHEAEITGLSLSSSYQGLLVTSSNDSIIKVWDILDSKNPSIIWEKKTNLGALQCLAANPDIPLVFAVGGDNKSHNFKVIDLSEISAVNDRFKKKETVHMEMKENSVKSENQGRKEELMEVTEDMGSMALNMVNSLGTSKKRKK
ncbi:periodic tryptophan protein 1 homolog [Polistes fuscatus]|uniref:periodic tryptophan protein 1 homolog n=1 Tax=Polistes fuscatus TaxID=30207 RepID=UPI001CA9A80E|nr:periodic tryptophan protein 1 homolog [Polistes fuscatus]